jgi:hypothetical protein
MVTKLKTGTKVGQLGIWDGTQWVAGDPDCNIVKWGGTALTARDISLDLQHLSDAYYTGGLKVLNVPGNVLGVTDNGLLKLDVDLSTRARLQPWYQANFTPIYKMYDASSVAPAAATERWTYTVPASRIGIVTAAHARVIRNTVATTAARQFAWIEISSNQTRIVEAAMIGTGTGTVGEHSQDSIGWGPVLKAGDIIRGMTYSNDTDGTASYNISASLMVFDT